jgi:hypothetical protein
LVSKRETFSDALRALFWDDVQAWNRTPLTQDADDDEHDSNDDDDGSERLFGARVDVTRRAERATDVDDGADNNGGSVVPALRVAGVGEARMRAVGECVLLGVCVACVDVAQLSLSLSLSLPLSQQQRMPIRYWIDSRRWCRARTCVKRRRCAAASLVSSPRPPAIVRWLACRCRSKPGSNILIATTILNKEVDASRLFLCVLDCGLFLKCCCCDYNASASVASSSSVPMARADAAAGSFFLRKHVLPTVDSLHSRSSRLQPYFYA